MPSTETDVVVLSKFPQIFEGFRAAIDDDFLGKKFVVWDNADAPIEGLDGWWQLMVGVPFQIAKNANIGWRVAKGDVIYCGDDVRLIQPRTCERLRELAYSDPKIGILAPRIQKEVFPWQVAVSPEAAIPFVCVFIKRELIDAIGYLDERYTGYGVEDIDFCYRARLAGWKVCFANQICIRHGVGDKTWGSTFLQLKSAAEMAKEDAENWRLFAEKYGLPNDKQKLWDHINAVKP